MNMMDTLKAMKANAAVLTEKVDGLKKKHRRMKALRSAMPGATPAAHQQSKTGHAAARQSLVFGTAAKLAKAPGNLHRHSQQATKAQQAGAAHQNFPPSFISKNAPLPTLKDALNSRELTTIEKKLSDAKMIGLEARGKLLAGKGSEMSRSKLADLVAGATKLAAESEDERNQLLASVLDKRLQSLTDRPNSSNAIRTEMTQVERQIESASNLDKGSGLIRSGRSAALRSYHGKLLSALDQSRMPSQAQALPSSGAKRLEELDKITLSLEFDLAETTNPEIRAELRSMLDRANREAAEQRALLSGRQRR